MSKKKATPNEAAITRSENGRQPVTHNDIVPEVPKAKSRKLTKQMTCLSHLLVASLNKLDALRLYGETCLNTTISQLGKKGYDFTRKREPHINRVGDTVRFMRYTLTPTSAQRAKKELSAFTSNKGAE